MNYNFKKLVKKSMERKGKDKYYFLSSKKIRNELKWKPNVSLENGISRCINWLEKNHNSFTQKDLSYSHKK